MARDHQTHRGQLRERNPKFRTIRSITRRYKGGQIQGGQIRDIDVHHSKSQRNPAFLRAADARPRDRPKATRPRLSQMRAAVQLVILSGDEAGMGPGEKTDHLGDVLRRAAAADQGLGK